MSENIFPKTITDKFSYSFSVDRFGLYAITLMARCRSAKQIGQTGGEDLWVEIDGRRFREVPEFAKPQYQDIPPAWNGSRLNGLNKTVVFLLLLDPGQHELVFISDKGGMVETEPQLRFITNYNQIKFNIEQHAEDGDRRPWFTIALIDLPLKSFSADVTVNYRFRDSDDVKLLVDGKVKKNYLSILRRSWLWLANILTKISKEERQKKIFEENLGRGDHYIEFWADRMPILHEVVLDLGLDKLTRIPSVRNPKWTGENFRDDSEQMILARAIFGEARDSRLSDKVRVAVGWTIRNRVEDLKNRWGKTYHAVILQVKQYSAFNQTNKNRPFVENPLFAGSEIDRKAWFKCYEIAGQVLNRSISDPTEGANHYFDDSIGTPSWATKENFVIKIDTISFYRL